MRYTVACFNRSRKPSMCDARNILVKSIQPPITKPEAQPNYTERSVVKPATLKNYFYLSTAPCYRHDLIFNALTTKTH
jgi:hypothetical protein